MKTITYALRDGGTITASNATEFVILLREGSRFDSNCSNEEFMANFAIRYKELHDISISDESYESFFQNLIHLGYATKRD